MNVLVQFRLVNVVASIGTSLRNRKLATGSYMKPGRHQFVSKRAFKSNIGASIGLLPLAVR
jgi:hypothetical protein